MINVTIRVEMENADFQDDPHGALSAVLESARDLTLSAPGYGSNTYKLRDRNGNAVGTVEVAG